MDFAEFWQANQQAAFEDGFAPIFSVRFVGTLSDYEVYRPQILGNLTRHAARRRCRLVVLSEPIADDGGFTVYGIGEKV